MEEESEIEAELMKEEVRICSIEGSNEGERTVIPDVEVGKS